MLPKVLTSYKHIQETAASVWTINHGAGGYPCVDVYIVINDTPTKITPSDVTYVNPTTCAVSFSVPRTGFAQVS
jgi:hypothetical protein